MSRVFVTQNDGRFDLSDLRRYGEPVPIFTRDLYPDNSDEAAPAAMKHAFEKLEGFDPADDYLCLVGSPLYTAICSYVLGDMGALPVRLLRYDRIEGRYYPIALR